MAEGIADIILIGNEEKIMDGAGWLEVVACCIQAENHNSLSSLAAPIFHAHVHIHIPFDSIHL